MSPRTAYAGLLEQLYLARAERTLTMTEEHEFACDLEELWYKLSDAEQGEVEDLTEEYKRDVAAPAELGIAARPGAQGSSLPINSGAPGANGPGKP